MIRSPLRDRKDAPKQGDEGAPDAWLEISSQAADGLHGIAAGDEIIIITWLHQGHRDVLKVHPHKDLTKPLLGVFSTRSPDRPNALGPVRLVLFDMLYYRGRSLLGEPFHIRCNCLAELCAKLEMPELAVAPGTVGAGRAFFAAAVAAGHEGVVAKRLDSPYRPGRRSHAWQKIKPRPVAPKARDPRR